MTKRVTRPSTDAAIIDQATYWTGVRSQSSTYYWLAICYALEVFWSWILYDERYANSRNGLEEQFTLEFMIIRFGNINLLVKVWIERWIWINLSIHIFPNKLIFLYFVKEVYRTLCCSTTAQISTTLKWNTIQYGSA